MAGEHTPVWEEEKVDGGKARRAQASLGYTMGQDHPGYMARLTLNIKGNEVPMSQGPVPDCTIASLRVAKIPFRHPQTPQVRSLG